jgi:hypothetical protein
VTEPARQARVVSKREVERHDEALGFAAVRMA